MRLAAGRQWPYGALALFCLVVAPLGCATCGGEAATSCVAPEGAPKPGAVATIDSVPPGIALPRGNCGADMFLSTDKRCVPLAWHCPPTYYAGGPADGCDCNCGAPDPDCRHAEAPRWCYNRGGIAQATACDACMALER